MGWNGSLTANSAEGASITYTPDTSSEGEYTVSSFVAPKKGVYKFVLCGSGGTYLSDIAANWVEGNSASLGGAGGTTTGYLLLEAGETVYIGAGGTCSAAFVSKIDAVSLAATGYSENLYFVAGAGGAGGAMWGEQWNMKSGAGGAGGGETGGYGEAATGIGAGGAGGTQYGGFAYGAGGGGGYSNDGVSQMAGRGGDGYYGGSGGSISAGGGGGSGYVYSSTLKVGNQTYASSTSLGGGAGSGANGYVVLTYYSKAELPIKYNDQIVMELYYNNQEVKSLYYNGTKIY